MQFTVDISRINPAVRHGFVRSLHHEDRARHALGVIEQARLKKLYDSAAVAGFNTNLGRAQMILSDDQWKRAMQQYGQFCFMDPEFTPWLLKKNEDFRVKDVGTRIQSGWTAATGDKGSGIRDQRSAPIPHPPSPIPHPSSPIPHP